MIDYKHTFGQFWRYVIIGIINTGIDFGVFNMLSFAGGITSGNGLIPLNIISFSTAVVTGYFLHKRWSFQDQSQARKREQFTVFLFVTLIGAVINTAIVRLVATDIQPLFNLSAHEWLNVAKAIATAASLIWNFLGYKFWVFKK